ncbi:DExH-box splicing factor binding site-domain-containing protein [Daldinia caldariorum]|uniref:DExH-box splicing factor binding site-domain-containing protein n=1 Tax=Daldinia caldariorum TaxID=326644 RepID=UPI002007DA3F|nr:DExH-box splicing factor binding site-domain-containing protein [Daldinia caldariorum]KAI1465067.1 DExH-box splicing factor binding site-domain-containing protein [Daldinia caldariorum]
MPEPASRIAIKFGTSSSSSVNGVKKQNHAQPSSTLGKRHRAHALYHDSDSGSDDETSGRHEAITTIGDDISESESKRRNLNTGKSGRANAPYVITGHKNRDWKAELKAQRGTENGTPSRRNESDGSAERDPADQDKQIKWGLTVTKKPVQDAENSDKSLSNDQEPATPGREEINRDDETEASKHEDKDAIDALLGKKRKSAKDLVIEGSRHSTPTTLSEQDAYRRRMGEAAEVSTIEEYDQIPEGEFGAAMLRGMGWNGEERGAKPKEVKRRPNLMGLGSKEDEEIRKGELARKHGHRERRPRLDEYRRDKEKERRDRDERRADSYKSERERERERRDYGHSHHRDRDRDRDRDGHRHSERSHRC